MLSLSLKVAQGLCVAFECSGGEATRGEFESFLLEGVGILLDEPFKLICFIFISVQPLLSHKIPPLINPSDLHHRPHGRSTKGKRFWKGI